MPWRLHVRLWRWMARSAVREFPWAFGLFDLILIAVLVALGALDSTLGIVVVIALALAVLVLARFGIQALRTAETMREALADLDAEWGPDRARFPLSHVLLPPLMLFPRGVRRIRGVEFAR